VDVRTARHHPPPAGELVETVALPPLRVIRCQHPVCSDTRRQVAMFLQRDRVRQLVASAFALPVEILASP
jgi:hypothetical protein